MKKTRQLLLIAFSTLSLAFAQDYRWPVNLGKALSSNFGEFRPRRYHSGIDIRTDGSTGHEVFAVGSGYIWRVKVSSDGYGRALYLKLNDGNTAVYAHLDRFLPLLNDIARIEQKRHSSYAIDKYFGPNEFPVEKGDLLGFSGESGAAFGPHLHFELRDSGNRPVNPLTHGFPIHDRHRPVPQKVAIVPLSTDAIINGSPLPQIFPLQYTRSGDYRLPDTVHVFGKVGIEVSAFDKITGFANQLNIHGTTLAVDGIEHYRIEFDSLEFQYSHLIEIERDNSFRRLNDGDFHRLFTIDHSSELDFIDRKSRGQLSLTPGYHRINIKLFDHMKNVVRITGILYVAPPTRIRATVLSESPEELRVSLEPVGSPFPITDFVCYAFNEKGYVEEKVEALHSIRESRTLVLDLPRSQTHRRILQFIGIDDHGAVSFPFHLPMGVREADPAAVGLQISVAHLERSVLLQVDYDGYVSLYPQVVLRGPDKDDVIEMVPVRPTTFLSAPLDPERFGGTRLVVVSIQGSPVRETRFSFKPELIIGDGISAAISPDGYCSLQVLSSTFYDTTVFWIENVNRPVPVKGGKFMSRAYQLQPFDRPLQDTARVAIVLPDSVEDEARTGIFYYDQKNGWTFLPSRFSDRKRVFFTSVHSLEAVAIVQDTVRPVISEVFPGAGGHYDSEDLGTLSAMVDDHLAGIRNEEAIRMSLNGESLLFEYHPVKKTISFRLDEPLATGEHLITISATDQVGNTATKEIKFAVN